MKRIFFDYELHEFYELEEKFALLQGFHFFLHFIDNFFLTLPPVYERT